MMVMSYCWRTIAFLITKYDEYGTDKSNILFSFMCFSLDDRSAFDLQFLFIHSPTKALSPHRTILQGCYMKSIIAYTQLTGSYLLLKRES